MCVNYNIKVIISFLGSEKMNQDKSGKFIAKLRKEKNMTQEQLAEKWE